MICYRCAGEINYVWMETPSGRKYCYQCWPGPGEFSNILAQLPPGLAMKGRLKMTYADELIAKYATKAKSHAYERPYCLVCAKPLTHKPTGRPRRFCGDACKQKDYREMKNWVQVSIENMLIGLAEPPQS